METNGTGKNNCPRPPVYDYVPTQMGLDQAR